MGEMTSIERVEAVLSGRIPDQVPVDLHNFMMTAHASGMAFPEYFRDGEAMAEGQIKAWREYGHDVLMLENGTAALAEACGCGVEYLDDSAPVAFAPVIHSLDDVDKLEIPDPYTTFPLSENLKSTRIVAREVGERAFIIGRADQGPFSLASMLIGMEEFLMALAKPANHDKLHRLLEFSLEVVYRYAVAQLEQGAHMTSIGESLAGPDVCSPKMYREYEWGYAKRLVDRLADQRHRLAYHICGDATRIVDDMIETGATVLELDYKCDLAAVKAATQGRTTILGTIDPSRVLALGTADLVTQECRATMEVLMPDGGLILGPGCALPPTTPPDNVRAMLEAAHQFGRYA